MALSTFAPEIAPSPGGTIKPQIKILKAEFGDGYSQPTPAGLNHIRKIIDLRWEALTEAQKTYIENFFETHGGYKTFLYQPFGFAAPLKWTCSEWSISPGAPWSVSAKFEQSFYIGV